MVCVPLWSGIVLSVHVCSMSGSSDIVVSGVSWCGVVTPTWDMRISWYCGTVGLCGTSMSLCIHACAPVRRV